MTIRPVLCVVLLCAGSATAKAECIAVDNAAIGALFDGWNLSLASLDPDVVAQRYWPDAVLLPTVSNTPRTSTAMIRDYFVHFLEKRPRGRIDSRTIQIGCNLAIDMGTYTFSVMAPTGAISEVAARYTFVYSHHDGAWKISHHHSSAMPETGASVRHRIPPTLPPWPGKVAAAMTFPELRRLRSTERLRPPGRTAMPMRLLPT